MNGIIYLARNNINGKIYIGQTNQTLQTRITGHYGAASLKKKDGEFKNQNHFCRALRKYKKDDWYWMELLTIPEEHLGVAEEMLIAELDSMKYGYNSTPGGDFNPMKVPEIARLNGLQKKGRPFSAAHKEAISIASLGKKLSEETKRKIGEASRGNKHNLGRPCTEHSKELTSLRSRGSGNAAAKLTEEKVAEIREKRKLGATERQLAEEYGVHRGTINSIINYRSWKH